MMKMDPSLLSDETLALYFTAPMNHDLILGKDMDAYSKGLLYRICTQTMAMRH
jgi:hypothetical protein